MTITINLQPAEAYRAEHYGVLMESTSRHIVTGPRVHNPSFPHRVDVWENRNGTTPMGKPTTAPYSYYLTAQPVAIVANPAMRDATPEGETLRVGDHVRLAVHGYVLGEFLIRAESLSDPVLIPVEPGADDPR